MAIQKKSLIKTLKTTKKANVAKEEFAPATNEGASTRKSVQIVRWADGQVGEDGVTYAEIPARTLHKLISKEAVLKGSLFCCLLFRNPARTIHPRSRETSLAPTRACGPRS
jgi:hypothetical protein